MIDMTDSVDNEHYCMRLLHAFGLDVAQTEIVTFGARRVLVVERFDRRWRGDSTILPVPQEDCCQALGVPPTRKYQSEGGPGMREMLGLLKGAQDPQADQTAFLKSQIIFWLIGATDGHAKNFSIFLRPGNSYSLTPLYDVLSAQPAADKAQIPEKKFRLAMSVGENRHYRVEDVMGRHFVQSGKAAGLGARAIRRVITDILDSVGTAAATARAEMPGDFAGSIHDSIAKAIDRRLPRLASALADLPIASS
jgi:serine/threonine-protein kinase HipA